LRAYEDELFGRFDLTPQQYNLLRLLRSEYPQAQPTLALADRLVSRAPDITRMLDKLEKSDLIVRERPGHDRRIVRVGITRAGMALLGKIDESLRACHERQLGHMAAADLKRLATLLRAARLPHEPEGSSWK
jgi:DNA-binding MarR family transcriptional regulator